MNSVTPGSYGSGDLCSPVNQAGPPEDKPIEGVGLVVSECLALE